MTERLDDAVAVVPQLQAHRDRLAQTFAGVGGLGSITTQRVHGDLHLGQTLRTVVGWKLVDFEGEPAKPLAEPQPARLALARRRRHAAARSTTPPTPSC